MNRRALPTLALLLGLGLPLGCRHLGGMTPPPPAASQVPAAVGGTEPTAASPARPPPFTPAAVRPEAIPGEIAALELAARDPAASAPEKAETLRRLALLHLDSRNPARSPKLAAAAHSAHLELLPDGATRQEAEIWLDLLREQLGSEQLLRQQSEKLRDKERALADLGAEKQRLGQKNAALETANAKLKDDIEKLKFIDLSVEKKRKTLR